MWRGLDVHWEPNVVTAARSARRACPVWRSSAGKAVPTPVLWLAGRVILLSRWQLWKRSRSHTGALKYCYRRSKIILIVISNKTTQHQGLLKIHASFKDACIFKSLMLYGIVLAYYYDYFLTFGSNSSAPVTLCEAVMPFAVWSSEALGSLTTGKPAETKERQLDRSTHDAWSF